MKVVLLSGSYKKIDIPLEVIKFIKNNLNHKYDICFIAADFNAYFDTDKFVKKLLDAFDNNGMSFNNITIVDSRLKKHDMIENIKNSNIIFLLGGDTLKQIKSIKNYGLKKYIYSDNKVVIGISAGAINMAKKVILAKDEEDNIPNLSIYNGLGFTDINIEPHCDFKNQLHWRDLEEASDKGKLLLMNDNCYIIINDNIINYFGDYCYLENRKLYYKNKEVSLDEFLEVID